MSRHPAQPPTRRAPTSTGGPFSTPVPGIGMPRVVRAGKADREARTFLRFVNGLARRPVATRSLGDMRRQWRMMALALGRRLPVASVTEHVIAGPAGPIALRVFAPESAAVLRPAFLWCHGGGFVLGGVDTADSICRNIARATGAVVVAVAYRLAPEHDIGAGREDFLAALDWMVREGATLGIDASRLAVGGDSAGGNIAAAVAQQCLRRGGPALRLQVLVYPATDLQSDFPSKAENQRGHLLTAEFIDWSKSLIGGALNMADPWLSPALHPDLCGLPPALIVSAGFDPIRDDGLGYAARLRDAGVNVELLHYAGQFHGFLNFDSVIGAARDALDRIGHSLLASFADEAPQDRTIEIADAAPQAPQPLRDALHEGASATLMFWSGIEQWGTALLRLGAPRAAPAAAWLLRPWLTPAAWARQGTIRVLDGLIARQTHPQPFTVNQGGLAMATTPNLDPFEMWRQALSKLEGEFNSLANKSAASGELTGALSQFGGVSRGMQQAFEKALAGTYKRLNLSSRQEMTALAESLQRIEGKLDELLTANAPPTRGPGPARTRRPPDEAAAPAATVAAAVRPAARRTRKKA